MVAKKEKSRGTKKVMVTQAGVDPQSASASFSECNRDASNHAPPLSGTLLIALMCLSLAIATVCVYYSVTAHPFINYDDGAYVTQNSHVNTGLTRQNVRWALTGVDQGNWHPLTWLSHAMDCQFFGLNAAGHHATSLVLHVANVILLFLLLLRVTGAPWRSSVVAALFALHPFNVESVAWVAERKNLLCTLFFLLTLGAYGWYAQQPRLRRYLAVIVLFALSLASKPMVITLPCVLLLLDFWPLGRVQNYSTRSAVFPVPQWPFSQLVLEKLPLLLFSAVSAVITIFAQRSAGALAPEEIWPLQWRLGNAVHAYATYLWKAFFPMRLAPFYPNVHLAESHPGFELRPQ